MTLHTAKTAGSGQHGICARCTLPPSSEGHDGCLGTLPGPVMNACCGHGNDAQAYIQYWPGSAFIRGTAAVIEQRRMSGR